MRFVVAADHPSLPGHLPGRPIVPGVVLLDEVAALVAPEGWRAAGFPSVRFLRPVRPGDVVEVGFAESSPGAGRFSGSVGGDLVLEGRIDLVRRP